MISFSDFDHGAARCFVNVVIDVGLSRDEVFLLDVVVGRQVHDPGTERSGTLLGRPVADRQKFRDRQPDLCRGRISGQASDQREAEKDSEATASHYRHGLSWLRIKVYLQNGPRRLLHPSRPDPVSMP